MARFLIVHGSSLKLRRVFGTFGLITDLRYGIPYDLSTLVTGRTRGKGRPLAALSAGVALTKSYAQGRGG